MGGQMNIEVDKKYLLRDGMEIYILAIVKHNDPYPIKAMYSPYTKDPRLETWPINNNGHYFPSGEDEDNKECGLDIVSSLKSLWEDK